MYIGNFEKELIYAIRLKIKIFEKCFNTSPNIAPRVTRDLRNFIKRNCKFKIRAAMYDKLITDERLLLKLEKEKSNGKYRTGEGAHFGVPVSFFNFSAIVL